MRQYAKGAGAEAVYTDATRMLNEADVEAVDICTIHDQHLDKVLIVANAGKCWSKKPWAERLMSVAT